MKNKWVDLNIKEKIAIVSAVGAFVLGWAMSILGFWIPPIGEVADSVLWILGQALIYSASVFGVTSYFTAQSVKMKADINKHIERMERLQIQRERLRHGQEVDELPNEIEDEE